MFTATEPYRPPREVPVIAKAFAVAKDMTIGALNFHIVNGDYETLTYDQKFNQEGSHMCKNPKCIWHVFR